MERSIITAIVISLALMACMPDKASDTTAASATQEAEAKSTSAQDQKTYVPIETDEALVATSLMAAPAAARNNCTVIGYNLQGEFVTFREGTNEFIVLADDPKKKGFSAACYHKSLEPFMARGRALKAEGKSREEIFEIRAAEIASGALKMGDAGSTLHIYFGSSDLYDPESFAVEDARYRYVVYMPYATAESTGLPIQPVAPNHPWIMDPGTHRAHIMISPVDPGS